MFQHWFKTIQQCIHTLQHSQPFNNIILVFNIRSELFNNVSLSTNRKKHSTCVKIVQNLLIRSLFYFIQRLSLWAIFTVRMKRPFGIFWINILHNFFGWSWKSIFLQISSFVIPNIFWSFYLLWREKWIVWNIFENSRNYLNLRRL